MSGPHNVHFPSRDNESRNTSLTMIPTGWYYCQRGVDLMSPVAVAYTSLLLAIVCEVSGTASLQRSEQFSKLLPSILTCLFYGCSFYLLSHALRAIPLGVAYAIWAGFGIVLTALVGLILFRQSLDGPAALGIAMIVCGVVVIQMFSKSVSH